MGPRESRDGGRFRILVQGSLDESGGCLSLSENRVRGAEGWLDQFVSRCLHRVRRKRKSWSRIRCGIRVCIGSKLVVQPVATGTLTGSVFWSYIRMACGHPNRALRGSIVSPVYISGQRYGFRLVRAAHDAAVIR
jgi:hypothetical protein